MIVIKILLQGIKQETIKTAIQVIFHLTFLKMQTKTNVNTKILNNNKALLTRGMIQSHKE